MANSVSVFHSIDTDFLSDALQLSPVPDLALLGGHPGLQNKSIDVCAILFSACRDNLATSPKTSRPISY